MSANRMQKARAGKLGGLKSTIQIGLQRFLVLTAMFAIAGASAMGCSGKNNAPSATGAASTGSATLTWSPNIESDLAGYNVYVGHASGSFGLPISVGNTTAFQVTGLTVGQTYKFAVTAVDASRNESSFSNEAIKVIVAIPQNGTISQSATYYVDQAVGSDANSCQQAMSPVSPKQTITSGILCLSASDALVVKAGTYDESFDDPFPHSGNSWADKIMLKADPPGSVIIKPSTGEFVMAFESSSQKYIEFDGIIIDASNAVACGVCIHANAHHIRFKNSAIVNAAQQGVTMFAKAGASPDFNEFINVEVANAARNRPCFGKDGLTAEDGFCHGFYIGSNYNLLDGVNLHHNNGYGLQFYPQGNRNNTIRNSRSHDNRGVGIASLGDGNTIMNNVIYNNGGGGLLIIGANNRIFNNTVYNNPLNYDGLALSGTGHSVKNNVFFLNFAPGVLLDATNLVGVDPQFVDAATENFRLQATSPAIDAGVALQGVTTAIDGVSRPQGIATDIGAYEFSVATDDVVSPVAPADVAVL
jgi:hypothetical protein